jgi:hypothetical protein
MVEEEGGSKDNAHSDDMDAYYSDVSMEVSDSDSNDDTCCDKYIPAGDIIDVEELSSYVELGQAHIRTLKDKDVVLVLGKTRVGKSTLIQMINGAVINRDPSSRVVYRVLEDENYLDEFRVGYQ